MKKTTTSSFLGFSILLFLLIYSNSSFSQKQEIWGVTRYGGEYNSGTLFKIDSNGQNFKVAHTFFKAQGSEPDNSRLCQATNGKLYGLASKNGNKIGGTLFEFNPITKEYSVKVHFDRYSEESGHTPLGHLIQATNGKLYGMTSLRDGPFGYTGTLFEYDIENDKYITLRKFYKSTGAQPWGGLVQASNGKLYGMTVSGGQYSKGVVFEFDIELNSYSVMHNFSGGGFGRGTTGTLMEASDGKIYGITDANSLTRITALLFSIETKSKKFSIVKTIEAQSAWGVFDSYNFGNVIERRNKLYGGFDDHIFEYDLYTNEYLTEDIHSNQLINYNGFLTLNSDSNIVGLANRKIIYEYSINNKTVKIITTLDSNPDVGYNDNGAITIASNGNYYGVTRNGNNAVKGSLYEYNPSKKAFETIIPFEGSIIGQNPIGGLTFINNKFYGICSKGGKYGYGTIFCYDPSSEIIIKKHDFKYTPAENMFLEGDSLLVGLINGRVYSFNTSNDVYTERYELETSDGSDLQSGLIKSSNGLFYGTANTGSISKEGSLFSFDLKTNEFQREFYFNWICGRPRGELIEINDSILIGQSKENNKEDHGTIFEFNINTKEIDLVHQFQKNGAETSQGHGSLIKIGETLLIGTTLNEGAYNDGTLFTYDTETKLYNELLEFGSPEVPSRLPRGNLLLSSSGTLYGTTERINEFYGSIYSYNKLKNEYNLLHTFTDDQGQIPVGYLTEENVCYHTASVDKRFICDSLVWIDGITYKNNNNTATYNLKNSIGCDSIITLDLIITTKSTSTIFACDSIKWIDGNTYYEDNNSATYTVKNSQGCDSTITLDLTINSFDHEITPHPNATERLTSNTSIGSFKWYNCSDNFKEIYGQTKSYYTPTILGSYASIVTINECIDTSNCIFVDVIGLENQNKDSKYSIYPNPFDSKMTIKSNNNEKFDLIIYNSQGIILKTFKDISNDNTIDLDLIKGTYLLEVISPNELQRIKIHKN